MSEIDPPLGRVGMIERGQGIGTPGARWPDGPRVAGRVGAW